MIVKDDADMGIAHIHAEIYAKPHETQDNRFLYTTSVIMSKIEAG